MDKRIIKIAGLIRKDAIGIVPTDTLFGLVGSALSKKAVEKIYQAKNRDPQKPFIVLINNLKELAHFGALIIPTEEKILKKFWPGKISVILPIRKKKFHYPHRGTGAIAFRMPKSAIIRDILKQTGPLVAPSANPENLPPADTIKKAKEYFGNQVDFYLGGKVARKPSTLVRLEKGRWKIIREGAIANDSIFSVINNPENNPDFQNHRDKLEKINML